MNFKHLDDSGINLGEIVSLRGCLSMSVLECAWTELIKKLHVLIKGRWLCDRSPADWCWPLNYLMGSSFLQTAAKIAKITCKGKEGEGFGFKAIQGCRSNHQKGIIHSDVMQSNFAALKCHDCEECPFGAKYLSNSFSLLFDHLLTVPCSLSWW